MNDQDNSISRRHEQQRKMAADIVRAIVAEVGRGMPADAALARIFKQHPEYGSRDRRFYAQAVFSYFRWLGWTRRLNLPDMEQIIAWSVILDSESSEFMMDVWRSAPGLTDNSIELPASATLEQKAAWLAARFSLTTLSPEHLLPDWTVDAMESPAAHLSLTNACAVRPPSWIALSPEHVESFSKFISEQKLEFRRHPYLAGAIAITSPFHVQQLEKLWGHPIQVQDIASQAVVQVCQAKPGESWWDTCSGAGGKTLGLARSVGRSGSVFATDLRDTILANLERRVRDHGMSHITLQNLNALEQGPSGRRFDGVLVDAPCSGLGTWPRNPDARWRITPSAPAEKAVTQSGILAQAVSFVKSGGVLVYSVCTLTRCEGVDVIRRFLEEYPHFELQPFLHPLTQSMTGGECLILPTDGPGDGMFVARLQRIT